MSLHAILLAAGAGRRLGCPKAALRLRGKWMLPHLVRSLREGGASAVTVVLGPAAARAIAGFGESGADRTVLNPAPEAGRTGSILIALDADALAADGVLLHPCDVPLLRPEVVARVIEAWRAAPEHARLLARPVTPSGRGGHPLLVGAGRLPTLRAFPPGRPLRDLLDEDRARVLNVPVPGDPGPFLDVDHPEQLRLLEDLLEQAPGPSSDPEDPRRD